MKENVVLKISPQGDNATDKKAIELSGWTSIRIISNVERLPIYFDLAMTSRYPEELNSLSAYPGSACQISLDDQVVATGYIDKFIPTLLPDQLSIRVTGRGKCQDLVDCAAEWPGRQFSHATLLTIAQNLAKVYGIEVSTTEKNFRTIPQFNLMLGETAFDVIERICRYEQLLCYELPNGHLHLTQAGTETAAGCLTEGKNIEAATLIFSMDQRYSDYVAYRQSFDQLFMLGEEGNLIAQLTDKGCSRHRQTVIIAEAVSGGVDVAKRRAQWELNRRAGLARKVHIVTDSWHDASGKLWQPNMIMAVDLPSLKLPYRTPLLNQHPTQDLLIGEVMLIKDEHGTHAELTLMDPAAYRPEPIVLAPLLMDFDS